MPVDISSEFYSALDNHNIANGDESWFEKRARQISGFSTDVYEGVTKGIPAATISGLHSVANSGAAIANFMGASIEPFNTYETLKSFDNDLGEYYKEHKFGADIAGFVATSLIPGTLGIKALQAAKAGVIGANTGRATGLLPSLTREYAQLARAEFAAGNSPFAALEKNTMLAIIQGFGSQALDAAAFELAVTATMFKSPILTEQSAGDIFHNMVIGTLVGGGIGGVLHGIGTVSGIKKSRAAVDRELFPYRNFEELDSTADHSLKILNYMQQKANLPEVQLLEDMGPIRKGVITPDLTPETRLRLVQEERVKTLARIDVLIQKEVQGLAGNDEILANNFYKIIKDATSQDDFIASMLHTTSISRISASERLVVGDVQFLAKHDIDAFVAAKQSGAWDDLLKAQGTKEQTGYSIVGDLINLKVTGAKLGAATDGYETKDAAFKAGYDVFRNQNGSISVNPASKILQRSDTRRLENNFILDSDNNGIIVDKATAGIQDYATKESPLVVKGNQVLSGNLPVIGINPASKSFDPVGGNLFEVQARYMWAQEQKNIHWDGKIIHENDLPMLERAFYDGARGFTIELESGVRKGGIQGSRLEDFIQEKKYNFSQKMSGVPLDEMGMRLNVSDDYLKGGQDAIAKIRPGVDYKVPRYIKVNFRDDINALEQLQKNYIDGAIQYEYTKKLVKQRHQQTSANYMGDMYDHFPEEMNWSDPGRVPTSYGAGASFLGFANSAYGSAGAFAQVSGMATAKLKTVMKTKHVAEPLNPILAAVALKGNDAMAEVGLLLNRLRESPERYIFDPTRPDSLILRKHVSARKDGTIRIDQQGADAERININHPEVAELYRTHSNMNQREQTHWDNLKGDAGISSDFDPAVVYPIPINTEKLKHFVFVKPAGITLGDKTRVMFAKDVPTLEALIKQVDPNEFRVITAKEVEEWHKALGDYEFSKGINESRVDSTMRTKGTLTQFIPTTNKAVLEEFMEYHMRQEEMLATAMVEHRYSQNFAELRELGNRYTNVASSVARTNIEKITETVKDPYNDVVKTALDISRASEYQWWKSFNDTIKDAIEGPGNKIREIFGKSQRMDDNLVTRINGMASQQGYEYGWGRAALEVANTNTAQSSWLPKAIAKGQAIMSATLLQLDFFNALNNTVGSPIILSAEVNSLVKAIQRADPLIAGKLADLMKVTNPDGSGIQIPTTRKLITNALSAQRGPEAETFLTRFQQIGTITDVLQQERMMLDELTWNFAEKESVLSAKLDRAYDFGKKWTGNRLAEETTRFVASHVMHQITDLALQAGVLRSVKEADEYIQLFVNRTQGNYLHSQRPIVFQGVVGQAISLFQTYQFNLMQQLFRYVGEGDKKSIGILLGMQGSIYGTQGLPAFNFLNTHIVGNAAGNTNHTDLYEAGNSVFGKALGDWMLYGLGSNALGIIDPGLRVNLYSRGDINPRRLTVLPTNIADIPLVAASTRFVSNLWTAAERIGGGADIWPTVSQAIEHNGLSRPLAGLAQSVQGYTTTSKGSLLTGGQDLFSIATLMRVGGAKPFDEGVALDELYRINAYRAKNIENIKDLGSTIKTTVIAGRNPTEEQISQFAADYAKKGGHVESFNRFFTGVMTSANKSQVNSLVDKLNSPFAKQMSVIMGGERLPDYLNQ